MNSNSGSDLEQDASDSSRSDVELEMRCQDSKILLNEGWANSIAKILKTSKPRKKKSIVLSKAKKLTDPVKKIKTENYEIATDDGQLKKEVTVIKQQTVNKNVAVKKKRTEMLNVRVKPNILEKDKDRVLQKIATKGVVQLFNAVKLQQKKISKMLDEAGPLEVRKEKVLKNIDKRAFLDVLMREKSRIVNEEIERNKSKHSLNEESPKGNTINGESSWNVFRHDFLISAKMKDWDKALESEGSEDEMEVENKLT